MIVWLVYVKGDLHGAHWAHDIAPLRGGKSAWIGSYYFPKRRGKRMSDNRSVISQGLAILSTLIQASGARHVWRGIRHDNLPAIRATERAGFHRVGVCKDFAYFEGHLVVIFACMANAS